MTPIPTNPWLSLGSHVTAEDLAWANQAIDEYYANSGVPQPRGESVQTNATQPTGSPNIGYPCCEECGVCEPCDQYCPRSGDFRFGLDESAFMAACLAVAPQERRREVEPVPGFLMCDDRAAQIEELLRVADAREWPKRPVRRAVG